MQGQTESIIIYVGPVRSTVTVNYLKGSDATEPSLGAGRAGPAPEAPCRTPGEPLCGVGSEQLPRSAAVARRSGRSSARLSTRAAGPEISSTAAVVVVPARVPASV